MPKNYNKWCKEKGCIHYVEWEYYGDELTSCKLMGQTNNIDEHPEHCDFIDEIKLVELET